ncbi:MAG: hypothetical protein ACE5JG_04900 [Planctomycetota bacterium]
MDTVGPAVANRNAFRPGDAFLSTLGAHGFTWTDGGGADLRVLILPPPRPPGTESGRTELRRLVRFVLDGGGLVLLAGAGTYAAGPLFLSAFGLECGPNVLAGEVEVTPTSRLTVESERLVLQDPVPVGGAGYVLLTHGPHCLALGAPRGGGRVVLAGSPSLLRAADPALAHALVGWISGKAAGEAR